MMNYGTFPGDKTSPRRLFEAGAIYIKMRGVEQPPPSLREGGGPWWPFTINFIYFSQGVMSINNSAVAAQSQIRDEKWTGYV